jgi:hypothetical protein
MRWVLVIGGLITIPVVGIIALELRANARVREVDEFCATIEAGQPSERVLEAAAEQELPVFTSATQFLVHTRYGARVSASLAFCDVRFEQGKVTSKEFFLD